MQEGGKRPSEPIRRRRPRPSLREVRRSISCDPRRSRCGVPSQSLALGEREDDMRSLPTRAKEFLRCCSRGRHCHWDSAARRPSISTNQPKEGGRKCVLSKLCSVVVHQNFIARQNFIAHQILISTLTLVKTSIIHQSRWMTNRK